MYIRVRLGLSQQYISNIFHVVRCGGSVSAEYILADDLLQCVCLVDALGNRTMRPCIATAAKIQVQSSFLLSSVLFIVVPRGSKIGNSGSLGNGSKLVPF